MSYSDDKELSRYGAPLSSSASNPVARRSRASSTILELASESFSLISHPPPPPTGGSPGGRMSGRLKACSRRAPRGTIQFDRTATRDSPFNLGIPRLFDAVIRGAIEAR